MEEKKKALDYPGPPGEKQFADGGQCVPGFSQSTPRFWRGGRQDRSSQEQQFWIWGYTDLGLNPVSTSEIMFSANSFLGICPRLTANIMWLTITKGKKKKKRNQPKRPKVVQCLNKEWYVGVINYKATAKNHFLEISFDNHYSHSPDNVKMGEDVALDPHVRDVKFTSRRRVKGTQEVYDDRGCLQRSKALWLEQGEPSMAWNRRGLVSALRHTPAEAVLGMPRRGRPEIGSSTGFSWDVGQCVISSKRWVRITATDNSKAEETRRAKLKRPLQRFWHSPKT